ncbi:MAG: TldD/PmbA family protein [bacterium]
MEPRDLVDTAIRLGKEAGADQVEAFFLEHSNLSIEVRRQRLETLRQSKERGIGIRVLKGESLGYAFTSDLTPEALRQSAESAVDNAKYVSPDPARCLPGSETIDLALAQFDPELKATALEKKIDLALAIEQAAFEQDKRISKSERSVFEEGEYLVAVANSYGLNVSYKGNFCGGYAWVVAEENGDAQTGSGLFYSTRLSKIDPEEIGKEAAQEALSLLGAEPVPTQKLALILPPQAATQFLGILAPALTAEAAQKGRSLFAGRVGQHVASDTVTLVDDGTLRGGINTAPVDGEGVPSQCTVLLEQGVLKGFLHNSYTAAKDGTCSTGNAMRGSFKGLPNVGPTNLFFAPGTAKPQDLVGSVKKGLLVLDLLGTHTANPISGDFSLGATGILIENGHLTRPVRGVVLAGNVVTLLKQVQAAADDLRFYLGYGSPTLLVGPLTVSGT